MQKHNSSIIKIIALITLTAFLSYELAWASPVEKRGRFCFFRNKQIHQKTEASPFFSIRVQQSKKTPVERQIASAMGVSVSMQHQPLKVEVEEISKREVVLMPEDGGGNYILNPGVSAINGWRCLFPRIAFDGQVSDKYPELRRSEIGLFIHNPDAKRQEEKKIAIDRKMLLPDDIELIPQGKKPDTIVALEDARATVRDGWIYLDVTLVRKDGLHYTAFTKHNLNEFIGLVAGALEQKRAKPNEDVKPKWSWSRLKRRINDGPCVKFGLSYKGSVLPGNPSSDGNYLLLYRPEPYDPKYGKRKPATGNEVSEIRLAQSKEGLDGPFKDIGPYVSMPFRKESIIINGTQFFRTRWHGMSCFVEEIKIGDKTFQDMLYHTGTEIFNKDGISLKKEYDLRECLIDVNNPQEVFLSGPILKARPDEPYEGPEKVQNGLRLWVRGVIYVCGGLLLPPNSQTNEYERDIYYTAADTVVKMVRLKTMVSGDVTADAAGESDKKDKINNAHIIVSKAGFWLYKSAPYIFGLAIFNQLVIRSELPLPVRFAGVIIVTLGIFAGMEFQKRLEKISDIRPLLTKLAAISYALTNWAFGFFYIAMPYDSYNLTNHIRSAVTFLLDKDRRFGMQRDRMHLEIGLKQRLDTGIISQAADIEILGGVGRYEDRLYSVGVDKDEFVLDLVVAKPGQARRLEDLSGRDGWVARINGGYYSRDDSGQCYPTGLEIKDNEVLSAYKKPGKMSSLESILVCAGRTGEKLMVFPSSFYQKGKYPFDGKTYIKFALQTGPLAVFNGEFRRLPERFRRDGRSLSAVAIDDSGKIYLIGSQFQSGAMFSIGRWLGFDRFIKSLIGPDYEITARFAAAMLQREGRKLVHFVYLDGGGSTCLWVKEGDAQIKKISGYHLLVNGLAVIPRIEAYPVEHLLMLSRKDVKKAAAGMDYLMQNKNQEEISKILLGLNAASPLGIKDIFDSSPRDTLKQWVSHNVTARRLLAELSPYRALGVFGINRRSSPRFLAANVNKAAGLPIRHLVEREVILALRRYKPGDRLVFLSRLSAGSWQWLGGIERFLQAYPELLDSLRFSPSLAIEVISNATSRQPSRFVEFLISRYSVLYEQKLLNLIFDLMEELNIARGGQFGDVARWLLLCDIAVSQPFLEAYLDAYKENGISYLVGVGLEETQIKAIDNLKELAGRSQKLKPVVDVILKDKLEGSIPGAEPLSAANGAGGRENSQAPAAGDISFRQEYLHDL